VARGDRASRRAERVRAQGGQADSAFGPGHHHLASGRIAAHNYSFVFIFCFQFKISENLSNFQNLHKFVANSENVK
jgi:hypothetical protein